MQLGARWRVGEPPHRSVPAALHAAISEQERTHPGAEAWTLTWLEGRPRCTLDDLVVVSLEGTTPLAAEADGADDDDWLD